jgi:hypothetical protein
MTFRITTVHLNIVVTDTRIHLLTITGPMPMATVRRIRMDTRTRMGTTLPFIRPQPFTVRQFIAHPRLLWLRRRLPRMGRVKP